MSTLEVTKKHRHFNGWVHFYKHVSSSTKTPMNFSAFIPDHSEGEKLKTLFWLSGLSCTEENFITKANFAEKASKEKIIIVCPDTSPRGTNLPGEHESYDFGSGAGFYVNATQSPWSENYKMYDYVVKELPELVVKTLPTDESSLGIFGHSMGGHGALVIGLKNPSIFKSISAFAPIVAPTQCPWGIKAFKGYLGEEQNTWKNYDACELVRDSSFAGEILIHQGLNDNFLQEQLKPELFTEAVKSNKNIQLNLKMCEDFDHSYYFISSFIHEHLEFHAKQT
jgi:S-formylglutathione hydrolase